MKVVITGGAGFIGCNAASRFLQRGDEVVVFDNLSRKGTRAHLEWLRPQGRLTFVDVDIREAAKSAATRLSFSTISRGRARAPISNGCGLRAASPLLTSTYATRPRAQPRSASIVMLH